MKLITYIKSLITEQASLQDVIDGIKKRKVLVIYYDGDEPGGRGLREIEPVCLGTSKAGNKILRAWDREGSSHTGFLGSQPLPGWRIFRLDKISTIKPTGEIYNEPRPDYNFNGDKTMNTVIVNAKFDDVTTTPTTAITIDNIIRQLPTIVTQVLTQLISDTIKRRGPEALVGSDFSKSAEMYNRLYKNISATLNKVLTTDEKNRIKVDAAKILNQNQEKIKQDILNKTK